MKRLQQLRNFWAEFKLRFSSMKEPWFYDKMSDEWRKENLNANT